MSRGPWEIAAALNLPLATIKLRFEKRSELTV
jgi:hypothetical protein